MVQMEEIMAMMRSDGIRITYPKFGDPDQVAIPIPSKGRTIWVTISVQERGEYVRLHVPGMSTLPRDNKKARAAVLTALMAQNRKVKLVKFGIDPTDGEIDAEIGIPVEDGQFSHAVLRRCMSALLACVAEMLTRIDEAIYGRKAVAAARGVSGTPGRFAGMPSFEEFVASMQGADAGAAAEAPTLPTMDEEGIAAMIQSIEEAMAGGQPGDGPAASLDAPIAASGTTLYDVFVTSAAGHIAAVVAAVRDLTGMPFRAAHAAAVDPTKPVKEGLTPGEADAMVAQLQAAGAEAEKRPAS